MDAKIHRCLKLPGSSGGNFNIYNLLMHLNYANNIAVVSEHIASAPALWIFKKKPCLYIHSH